MPEKPWWRAGKAACLNCPDCGALVNAAAAKFHDCEDHRKARAETTTRRDGGAFVGHRTVIATRDGFTDDGQIVRLSVVAVPGEDQYPSRSRQNAATLGGSYRYRRVASGWHKQPSGQSGGWVRSHEKTGKPVGRPKFKGLSEFGRLTLRQEFAGQLNGYSLEKVQAVLSRRGKPREQDRPVLDQAGKAVVTLVSEGRRRAALAEAIGVQRKTVTGYSSGDRTPRPKCPRNALSI
jgi:hypothetical protein